MHLLAAGRAGTAHITRGGPRDSGPGAGGAAAVPARSALSGQGAGRRGGRGWAWRALRVFAAHVTIAAGQRPGPVPADRGWFELVRCHSDAGCPIYRSAATVAKLCQPRRPARSASPLLLRRQGASRTAPLTAPGSQEEEAARSEGISRRRGLTAALAPLPEVRCGAVRGGAERSGEASGGRGRAAEGTRRKGSGRAAGQARGGSRPARGHVSAGPLPDGPGCAPALPPGTGPPSRLPSFPPRPGNPRPQRGESRLRAAANRSGRLAWGRVGGVSREWGWGRLRRAVSGVGRGRCVAGTRLGAPWLALRPGAERLLTALPWGPGLRRGRFPAGRNSHGGLGVGEPLCKVSWALVRWPPGQTETPPREAPGWRGRCSAPRAGSAAPAGSIWIYREKGRQREQGSQAIPSW